MKATSEGLRDELISLGLSAKEAAVYIALLELGRSTVSVISRRAQINRVTGYVILDALVVKGLVQISGKEPKQEYAAESPDKLATFFKKEAEDMDTKARRAATLALELKSVQKIGDRPQVKFYEGTDGIEQVYEDTLTSTEPIRVYATVEDAHITMPNYFPRYYQRRASKGIAVRGITPGTPLAKERIPFGTEEKREMLLVPPTEFTPHPEIDIYDNKVMIASWREKLGIIIESAEIADAMKKLFELAWIGATELNNKNTAR